MIYVVVLLELILNIPEMLIDISIKTDVLLFLDIQKGDEKAFDILFLRYYTELCAYARQFVGVDDREEVVQDVMVWLWENKEWVTIETTLRSYLFRAVKNACYTLLSRNEVKQRATTGFCENMSSYEDPDFYVLEELIQRLEKALKQLPDSYREAFELNRFHNMTYNEIAKKLEVSPKTIDYRIQQALRQLRKDLKDYLPLILLLTTGKLL